MTSEPITLSISQLKRQFGVVVDQIQEHGLQVIVTRRGIPIGVLLPTWVRPGRGIIILKRQRPVAALFAAKEVA